MDDFGLFLGFNTMVYGNVPIKPMYNEKYKMSMFTVIPDYSLVLPYVVGNNTIGYKFNDKYYFPHEFVYAQLQHYKDMNFLPNQYVSYQSEKSFIRNEFIPSPSYLSDAFRPFRVIRMIEDALLYQRLDRSQYFRIIKVKMRGDMTSKSNVKTLQFYRAIFKNVRRMSFQDGITSVPNVFGREYEVVIPENENLGVSVDNIEPKLDIKALRDLDIQYKKLWASLGVMPEYLGFSDNPPVGNAESPANRTDERFGRRVKTVQYSVHRAIKALDRFYLRSMGYDVSLKDFGIGINSPSTVEDEMRRKARDLGTDTFKKVVETFDSALGQNIKYNKDYLVKSLISDIFKNSNLDMSLLFNEDKTAITSKFSNPKTGLHKESINQESLGKVYSSLHAAGLLPDNIYDQIKETKLSEDDVHKGVITSGDGTRGKVKYDVYSNAIDVYSKSASAFKVDISEEVMLLDDEDSFMQECGKGKILKGTVIPFPQKVFTDKVEIDSEKMVTSIESLPVVYINRGRVYIPSESIPIFLFLKSSGYKEFVADRLYISK